jgi:hypothetical protein
MAIDLSDDFSSLKSRIKAIDTYNEITNVTTELTNQQQTNLEVKADLTLSPLSQLSEQKKRYQRQAQTQLSKLLDIDKLIPENRFSGNSASSASSFIKDSFSEALDEIKSLIPQIIVDEMLKELGCSQEQTYDSVINDPSFSTQGIFVPVESIDLMGYLKENPTGSTIGKLFYERKNIEVQSKPFSMNRELYQRIQNEGQSYNQQNGSDYKGASFQNLFDFTYVTQDDQGNQGNFFKVNLINRTDNKNLIGQFVTDYFESIEIVDTKNIYLQIMDFLFGTISINLKTGVGEINDKSYFQRILQRIMGLCFDSDEEINVSGIAKVSPLDGVDESFFELTDVDLRIIESEISNIKLGVFEYTDCTNIKQPLNNNEVLDNLLRLLDVDGNNSAANTVILNETLQTIKDKTIGPTFALGASIDEDLINKFPQAMFAAIISPKVLFPMMIMIRALEALKNNTQNSVLQDVYNLESFTKTFPRFNIQVASKISATFIKILRDIIVRDIRKLTRGLVSNLRREANKKRLLQTKSLLALSIILTQIVPDLRKCKSIIDSITQIVELALRGSRYDIPEVALLFADLRSGFSDNRAMIESIEEMQSLGIPTGPMPDGSPNLWLLSVKATIVGVERERLKNAKNQQVLPPLTVSPVGLTFPQKVSGVPS